MSERSEDFYKYQANKSREAGAEVDIPGVLLSWEPVILGSPDTGISLTHAVDNRGNPVFDEEQQAVFDDYTTIVTEIEPYIAATTAAPYAGNETFNTGLKSVNMHIRLKLFSQLFTSAAQAGGVEPAARNLKLDTLSPNQIPPETLARSLRCHPDAFPIEQRNRLSVVMVSAEHSVGPIACLGVIHGLPNPKLGPKVHYASIPLSAKETQTIFVDNAFLEENSW